ncbi:hypothetical protein Rhe02_10040 [Rhizocola hellebori]|uniref:Uncharacterized protein n=1 Tax=Rhizocola hellebori TaxID=1392758 RepID=A0A8J3VE32_9ACTN|nr:DUF6289 family protein [Rhizocola hellebori]GIH02937.1 hypothetical protein Rhe02_10040 [Rhizocola hellebori]
MFRRAILATALALGIAVTGAAPAQAIPPGDSLLVIAYYSNPSKTTLIGQQWAGCGQPSGSWGATSGYRNIFFTPC